MFNFKSSSSGGSKNYNYPDNLSGRDLTRLYNTGVRTAEVVGRPLNFPGSSLFPAREPNSHSGVRVTLEDNSRWLIHKGPDNAPPGSHQTVVTRAENMSSRWTMLLCALSVSLLAVTVESWLFGSSSSSSSGSSSGGSKNYNYPDNLSGRDLTRLYNTGVRTAEVVERPLNIPGSSLFPAREPNSHSGVRVTLEDNSRWLIHKGPDNAPPGSHQTVVTRAENMSPRWTETGVTRDFNGQKTMSDFVGAGGKDYKLFGANCHDAKDAMMNQK